MILRYCDTLLLSILFPIACCSPFSSFKTKITPSSQVSKDILSVEKDYDRGDDFVTGHQVGKRGASSMYPCRTMTQREKSLSLDFDCVQPGDFPITDECRLFLHCVMPGVAAMVGCCPVGMNFDHSMRRCVTMKSSFCKGPRNAEEVDYAMDYSEEDNNGKDNSAMDYNMIPRTDKTAKWKYYSAPKNLHPGAFWSLDPSTGYMWPAQFGYAIPLWISYSSLPIKIPDESGSGENGDGSTGSITPSTGSGVEITQTTGGQVHTTPTFSSTTTDEIVPTTPETGVDSTDSGSGSFEVVTTPETGVDPTDSDSGSFEVITTPETGVDPTDSDSGSFEVITTPETEVDPIGSGSGSFEVVESDSDEFYTVENITTTLSSTSEPISTPSTSSPPDVSSTTPLPSISGDLSPNPGNLKENFTYIPGFPVDSSFSPANKDEMPSSALPSNETAAAAESPIVMDSILQSNFRRPRRKKSKQMKSWRGNKRSGEYNRDGAGEERYSTWGKSWAAEMEESNENERWISEVHPKPPVRDFGEKNKRGVAFSKPQRKPKYGRRKPRPRRWPYPSRYSKK